MDFVCEQCEKKYSLSKPYIDHKDLNYQLMFNDQTGKILMICLECLCCEFEKSFLCSDPLYKSALNYINHFETDVCIKNLCEGIDYIRKN